MVRGGLSTTLRNLALFAPGLPTLVYQLWRERRELAFPEPPVRWLMPASREGGRLETEAGDLHLTSDPGWVRLRGPGEVLPGVLVAEAAAPPAGPVPVDAEGGLTLPSPPLRTRVGVWSDPRRPEVRGWALELSLAEHEHLYGLGERFAEFDLGGGHVPQEGDRPRAKPAARSHVLWAVDTLVNSVGSRAYKPVPLLLSCRGYGLFLHSTTRSLWSRSGSRLRVFAEGPLDLFVLRGPTPAHLLAHYTGLTGRPPVPPRWSFGLWVSRCMYPHRREVERVVEGLKAHQIPCDVISLDPLWLKGRMGLPRDAFTGRWNERRFPRPAEMAEALRREGLRLCLWMNPYLPKGFPIWREARERGLLPTVRGRPAPSMDNPFASPVDFSRPEARAWLAEKLEPILRGGAAAFKTDYGEEAPPDATYGLGDGRQVHNLYPLLYNRAVFEATARVHPRPMVWARSAWAGSQRYPVHWSGDSRCRWRDLPHVLRGGLNAAMSGLAHWSHDIGGFLGTPSEELYIRWAQFGLFVGHARCHGTTPREPWVFGERALSVFRVHVELRYRLVPYLYSCAHEAAQTGLPLLRPMVLEFPGDPETHPVDGQYMLGPSLLVAPVMEERATRKRVYFPAGLWTGWWSGREHRGPAWEDVEAPLERLPLFVREGAILPMAREGAKAEEFPNPLFLEVFPDGDGRARLVLREDEGETTFEFARSPRLRLVVGPGARDRTYEARFRGVPGLATVEVENGESVAHGGSEAGAWVRFTVRAGRGARVEAV